MKNLLFLPILLSLFYCSKKENNDDYIPNKNPNYIKATDYRDNGKTDSAFFYYTIAKDELSKINDTIGCAKSLINMAIIQTDKGDFFGGIETSLEAEKILKKNDSLTRQLKSSNYNNLALASAKQENYENAEKYFFLALENSQDKESKNVYYNNIGNNYLDAKSYTKAREFYKLALETKDSISYARALNNYARSYFLEDKNKDVLHYLLKSLKIRESQKDDWGLNSSYATLADYYKEKDNQKSFFYAKKMYEIAKKINNPDDRIESLSKLIALETPENSKKYFQEYKNLNDSVLTIRNRAKNQFALIRYETEKSKAENEKLKADSANNEIEILKRNIVVGLLIIGFIFSVFWYQRRQKLQAQQEQIKIKNTELKYSKKVHDVVANGIYRILSEVENAETLDKENLLDKLENIYEKSRDISYENLSSGNRNFYQEISELIKSYSNDDLKILIINEEKLWETVNFRIQNEVKIILQELLVNLKKHSFANFARISFEIEGNKLLLIQYFDNGIGISDENFVKKNGLQNTESRIFSIEGSITFVKNLDQGTKINIKIPI